jgi:hypothetical protein
VITNRRRANGSHAAAVGKAVMEWECDRGAGHLEEDQDANEAITLHGSSFGRSVPDTQAPA